MGRRMVVGFTTTCVISACIVMPKEHSTLAFDLLTNIPNESIKSWFLIFIRIMKYIIYYDIIVSCALFFIDIYYKLALYNNISTDIFVFKCY